MKDFYIKNQHGSRSMRIHIVCALSLSPTLYYYGIELNWYTTAKAIHRSG